MSTPAPWKPPAVLPQSSIRGDILLRYWTPEDAPAMLAALDEDRASYLPWLPWTRDDNRNLAEIIFNIERFRREREAAPPVHFTMGVFDAASGEALGGTGLARVAAPWHEAEIGYWVKPSARGRGVCTRTVQALLSWGFTPQEQGGWGFRRIKIVCAADNKASRRVPEKLGLRLESHVREERWVEGIGWCDSLTFGVLAHEWDRVNARLTRDGA